MTEGGDVFSTLNWGLRKYAWAIALFIISIGVLVPLLQSQSAKVYEARAQVGPVGALILPNLDPLPRLGVDLFRNGAVEDSVRQAMNLAPTAAVIPKKVELIAAQDNIVFTVIGRDSDPEQASQLANLAAATFTLQLNSYADAVGPFKIQRAATPPANAAPTLRGGYLSIVIGLLAGAIGGLGAVALLLVLRRPVVDAATAEKITGAPVLGRIRVPRGGRQVVDVMGVARLCRRVIAERPAVVNLASPTRESSELTGLRSAMTDFLGRFTASAPADDSRSHAQGLSVNGSHRQPEIVVLDRPSLEHWAGTSGETLTLLVVPEGIGLRSLRHAAAAYFTGAPAGIVMTAREKWRPKQPLQPGGPSRKATARSKPGKKGRLADDEVNKGHVARSSGTR